MKRKLKYKINKWIKNHIDFKLQPEKAYSKPNLLWLENGKACNLKCPMCAREMDQSFHKGKDIHDKIFEMAKPYFDLCDGVQLFGWNEPLMDKKIFDKMKIIRDSGANIHFNTNLTYLTKEVAQKILDIPVYHIGLSIDAATKEVYESIRIGADFDEIRENAKYLVNLKKERGQELPHLQIVFTAIKSNLDELPKMPAFAKDLGIDIVYVSEALFFTEEMVEKYSFKNSELMERLEEGKENARELGVNLNYVHMDSLGYLENIEGESENKNNKQKICTDLYTTMFILSNGDVLPCCLMSGHTLGNLNDQTIEEIWNGEGYRKLRRKIKEGEIPSICRTCPVLKDVHISKKQYYGLSK